MTNEKPWFVEQRAEWFASLVLTKHNDVKVLPYTGHDMAIDLLVEILKDGKSTLRFFGAQLVPQLDLPDTQKAEMGVLSHTLERDLFEASLPICVFVIGVRKPEGIWRWSVEPVVKNGRASLERSAEPNWRPLDEAGAAQLIGQVNAWYNVRNEVPHSKSRGRQSNTGS